jgi:hypothetical protein
LQEEIDNIKKNIEKIKKRIKKVEEVETLKEFQRLGLNRASPSAIRSFNDSVKKFISDRERKIQKEKQDRERAEREKRLREEERRAA